MNGREFLEDYRHRGGCAKVIVLSGAGRHDPLVQNLVVDGFIGKPFDVDQLVASVRRHAEA